MKQKFLFLMILNLILLVNPINIHAQKTVENLNLRISLQQIIPSEVDTGSFIIASKIQEWSPDETAIIICDMWDKHWCSGASARVAEMAPVMNQVITTAREKGVLIVHAPSECMDTYKNHPARKTGSKYKNNKAKNLISENKLEAEKDAIWPIDQSDGGCDCQPECKQGNPWTKQIDAIQIADNDAISDSGVEIAGLFQNRGIKNVILMGVHTNMCVIGRSFGLRNMVRLGYNVALMRDLTDTMYDSKQWPNVSHFAGNSLVISYIEKYVCPTMLSCDFTGKKQFRFKADNRPVVAFVSAEGEYRTNQRFPEFAQNYLIKNNINCEFALGKPEMKGEGRHNIENLQILKDADLAVIAVRRRALEPAKMKLIKDYCLSGKPILGIRVASHAFDAKQNVPREGGGLVSSNESTSEYLEQWPEFDKQILGGNYQGHYGHLKEGTSIEISPGMENHPLLKGINPDGFVSPSWLYKNRPLASENIQVLLTGKNSDVPTEPVMWINKSTYGKVVYTSLGHWDDWELEDFNKLVANSIYYLLNHKN
jgi:nicotinamidase-related amidase/type 1 glutamine amidotransferase